MKVSFDFDDTLATHEVQRLANMFIKAGYDIHIVTSRLSNQKAQNLRWNDDLYFIADILGIPDDKIHFCNLTPKWKFFCDNSDFDFHIDDDAEEVDEINKHCKGTKALHFVSTFDNHAIRTIQKEIE